MSMFRSAADVSSDSTSDIEQEVIEQEVPQQDRHADKKPPLMRRRTEPPPPRPESQKKVNQQIEDALASDAELHANFMTAALLEYYCFSRAADVLNAQEGSHKRYTRESPEVQYLGKKMFAKKSGFLSSHGVLREGIDTDELWGRRQFYRESLDTLGLSALEDLDLEDLPGQLSSLGSRRDSVWTVNTSSTPSVPDAKSTDLVLAGQRGPGLPQITTQLPGYESDMLRTLMLHQNNTSPASLQPFGVHTLAPQHRMSRYATEFSEVKILGRGSFGEVFHVQNHIDQQSYAIKKIPLSQRRLDQLKCGTGNQFENITKEIRTLARLEHPNVVRYYGAWLEHVPVQNPLPAHNSLSPAEQRSVDFVSQQSQNSLSTREVVDGESVIEFGNSQSSARRANTKSSDASHSSLEDDLYGPSADQQSDGIIFEYSEGSAQRTPTKTSHMRNTSQGSSHGVATKDQDVEWIPRTFGSASHSQLSTDANDDIYTDGKTHDPSQMQLTRRTKSGSQVPAVVLHIQMSMHPMSLNLYLNPQSSQSPDPDHPLPRRHCYHLVPSLRLMLGVISGVEYLHSKSIVHRDLKPANIFLCFPDEKNTERCPSCQSQNEPSLRFCDPRIGDFGLVADISSTHTPVPTVQDGEKADRIVGTEFYRPHLDFNGSEDSVDGNPVKRKQSYYTIDESLDVYALGVILFELLYRLSTKMERQDVLTALTKGSRTESPAGSSIKPPVFPADFEKTVDLGRHELPSGISVAESLMTCLRGMLEPDSSQRWSCAEIRRHLEYLLVSVQDIPCH